MSKHFRMAHTKKNTLRVITEQCIEWSSRLYTVFIDFEKAFDSINRETMWKEVKHYGLPIQTVSLIKETYRSYACRVVHEGQVSEPISVQTRVRKGCFLSPAMFLIVIEAVMRNVNRDRRRGIQWGLINRLEDLDFADDLCLLSETHGCMQMKLKDLTNKAENEEPWRRAEETETSTQIKRQKWNWIGHTLRKENEAIEREALDWNPQEKRRKGRPRRTWRRSVHNEALEKGKSWSEVKRMARNRTKRRCFVDALCLPKG